MILNRISPANSNFLNHLPVGPPLPDSGSFDAFALGFSRITAVSISAVEI
jgi:hypothetical protein